MRVFVAQWERRRETLNVRPDANATFLDDYADQFAALTPQGGEWNAAIEAAIGLFSKPDTLTFGPSGPRRVKSPEQKAIVAKLSTLLRSAIPDASPGSGKWPSDGTRA